MYDYVWWWWMIGFLWADADDVWWWCILMNNDDDVWLCMVMMYDRIHMGSIDFAYGHGSVAPCWQKRKHVKCMKRQNQHHKTAKKKQSTSSVVGNERVNPLDHLLQAEPNVCPWPTLPWPANCQTVKHILAITFGNRPSKRAAHNTEPSLQGCLQIHDGNTWRAYAVLSMCRSFREQQMCFFLYRPKIQINGYGMLSTAES